MRTYDDLPEVMAGFDVALMPFAHTEATRSISPTKTLEYLAAGLPVVSTRVPDVVADFADVVRFADDAAGFAAACVEAATRPATTEHARRLRLVRVRHEWDTIAEQMAALVDRAAAGRPGHTTGATVGVVGKEATA
jgi:glycosyltransferase involved in cell wall biosynthesis